MPTDALVDYVFWSVFLGVCLILLARVILPRLLAWRGVELSYTKFGPTLVFEAPDEDGTPVRLLNVGGAFQSACYASKDLAFDLVCEYQRTQAAIVLGMPRLRRAAVIGGGGFSFPKWLLAHAAPARVYVAEIDPAIIEVARQHFYLDQAERRFGPSGRLHIACEDGWGWLRAQTEAFDLILNEAFSGSRPLGALSGEEGALLVRSKLSKTGIYLADLRCPQAGRKARVMRETADAFARAFSQVWIIPEWPDDPKRCGNNVMVATDLRLEGSLPACAIAWHRGEGV